MVILIGPEGDFSEEEVVLARHHGFVPVNFRNEPVANRDGGDCGLP